jgi:hypothetical protein
MLTFLRDLIAHAEWANAVFFHVWGKSPARDHEELRFRRRAQGCGLDHLAMETEAGCPVELSQSGWLLINL